MFRSDLQGKLFGGAIRLEKWVGENTIHSWLGREGSNLFPDDLFREYYCEDNGRPCTSPHKLAVLTFLQMLHRCSDQEAIERSKYDDRWKCALDLEPEEKMCSKGTLQNFRGRLHLDRGAEKKFLKRTLLAARKSGLLPEGAKLRTVLDTTPLLGRGAVKDTYNLVADGIVKLCRALSQVTGEKLDVLTRRLGLSRYFEASSLKGSAEIDWSNAHERRVFLNGLVSDAERLLLEAQRVKQNSSEKQQAVICEAEELLKKLIVQDTEPDPSGGGVRLKQGVARDRTISVHDPEMRHSRKSASNRFNGHKAAVAAEPDSGLITAVEVQPGNTPDNLHALSLVEATERNTGMQVEKGIGDCAYGDGATRQAFLDAGRELSAKVPTAPAHQPFHKVHFEIDLQKRRVTCPAGHTQSDFRYVKSDQGPLVPQFQFQESVCQNCPHKGECLSSKDKKGGRTVTLHPQEELLQQARRQQNTPEFREDLKTRQRVEHRQAAMLRIGGRQAPYFGILKNRTRAVLIASVLNVLLLFGFLQSNQKTLPPLAVEQLIKDEAVRPRPDLEANCSDLKSADRAADATHRPRAHQASRPRGDPPGVTGSRSVRGDP